MNNQNDNHGFFDFEEEWDVEKVLQQRYEREQQREPERAIPQQPVQPAYQPAPVQRERVQREPAQRAPAQRTQRTARQNGASPNRRKKKTRVNWRGWAIVIGCGILALALLIGLIALIVHAIGGSDEPELPADATEDRHAR